jgi:hypothetical protein
VTRFPDLWCKRKESRQNVLALWRENRFRVELHSLHRKLTMAQRHDFAVVALGGDFETRRK